MTFLLLLIAVSIAAELPETLAEQALRDNPSLLALQARRDALRERARVAGAWPDPVLSVELSNAPVDSLSIADHPMAGAQLRLQQLVKPPGWSTLRRAQSDDRATAAEHALAEAGLQLRADIHRAWWQLTRARGLRALTATHVARTDELLASARVRFETGHLRQHALLRLEVLRNRLHDDLGDHDRADRELVAALNRALGSSGRAVPTPTEVSPIAPPDPRPWAEVAQRHRPALHQLDADRHAAEQRARLARLDGFPGVTVWAGYRIRTIDTTQDPGTDMVSLGVGVPLPAGSLRRSAGEHGAALHEASSAGAASEALLDQIAAAMEAVLARWARAHEKVGTYDDTLIPAARAALETARADFAVGRADFDAVFDAEVDLIDLERARFTAAIETHLQEAEAIRVLGTSPRALGGAP